MKSKTIRNCVIFGIVIVIAVLGYVGTSVTNGTDPFNPDHMFMFGGWVGFIGIWYCLIYSAWHFMKKRDVKNISIGIVVFCFLNCVPGIISVISAICLYLYQRVENSKVSATASQQ